MNKKLWSKELIFGFLVGLLCITGVYATTISLSSNVTYNNTKSNLTSTNVQDALDELLDVICPDGYICSLKNPSWIGYTVADMVTGLYENGTKTAVTTAGGEAITQVTSQNLMKDSFGNIRYYGKSPNNYVKFNNELWRIISVGNVKADEDDSTGETRIKIIRNESIGKYSWDSSASNVNSGYGVNDWSQADLKTELNTLYYNSQSGTCYNGQSNASTTCNFTSTGLGSEARSMLDDALYYLGGSSSYENLYADDYYTFERGTTVYSGRSTKWTGTLAVMYPSDYTYATDLSKCRKAGFNYGDDTTNCTGTDWLYESSTWHWSLSPGSDGGYKVFRVADGVVNDWNDYASNAGTVRPVGYLKSSVKISGGSGTIEDPFELSLN